MLTGIYLIGFTLTYIVVGYRRSHLGYNRYENSGQIAFDAISGILWPMFAPFIFGEYLGSKTERT